MSLRSSKLTGTVTYADGVTPFTGSIKIVLVVPGQNGEAALWPRLTVSNGYPTTTIPLWTSVKITNGSFSQAEGLWYNEDILPQNSRYAAYYYDAAGVQVGGPTSLFAAEGASTTPPTGITIDPSVPSASRTIPSPAEVF